MRYSIKSRILVLILTFFVSVSCYAQRGTPSEQAAALIEDFMKKGNVPGLAISVGLKGRIVWSEGFGYADLEQRVPIWPAITRFRVGSVAKPMTAVAVAQLHQQGRLDLDAPVQRFVPSFPDKEKGTITTRLLAGHLAGVRHYRNNEFLSQKHYPTVLGGLAIFKDDPLLHPPGTKYAYSSYAWNLISAVIEGASGQDFLEYMDENVFGPIGMKHTTADHVGRIILNRTRYYALNSGRIVNAPPVDNSYKWAGGGFLSTSEDLVRFGFAHLGSDLLRPETVRLLWASQKTRSGDETGYGIGWSTRLDDQGRRWVGHGGGSVGGSTSFGMYPDIGLVVVLISNRSGVRYGGLPREIAELFMSQSE